MSIQGVDGGLEQLLCNLRRLLGSFALGNIGIGADQAQHAATLAGYGRAPGQKPPHTAVLVKHPMLVFEVGGLPIDVSLRPGERGVLVVGMELLRPVVYVILYLVVLKSEDGFQLRVQVNLVGLEIPSPTPRPHRRPWPAHNAAGFPAGRFPSACAR